MRELLRVIGFAVVGVVIAAALAGGAALPAWAETVKLADNASLFYENDKVVAMKNLSDGLCHLAPKHQGTVVKREFDKTGLIPVVIVVETKNGERWLVNVDSKKWETSPSYAKGSAQQGIQTLTKVGSTIEFEVAQCGAAGRFLYLNSISAK